MTVSNPFANQGLLVIQSDSPNFRREIEILLTVEARNKALPFLPASFVIVNNTGRYLWGMTAIYTYPDSIAPAGSPWRRIIHLEAPSSERSRLFAPGARFLITPVSDFRASSKASGARDIQPYLDEGLERMIQLYVRVDSKLRLQATIDSLIWEDGKLIGPDSANRMQTLNKEAKADKELFDSLADLHGNDLRKQLLYYASLAATDPYSHRRARRSQLLLELYDKQGESAAVSAVDSIRSRQRFVGTDILVREEN